MHRIAPIKNFTPPALICGKCQYNLNMLYRLSSLEAASGPEKIHRISDLLSESGWGRENKSFRKSKHAFLVVERRMAREFPRLSLHMCSSQSIWLYATRSYSVEAVQKKSSASIQSDRVGWNSSNCFNDVGCGQSTRAPAAFMGVRQQPPPLGGV